MKLVPSYVVDFHSMCILCTGAVAVSAETFGEGSASRLLSRVDCVGNESSLLQCPTTQYSGGGCVTSGVACQGKHSLRDLTLPPRVWYAIHIKTKHLVRLSTSFTYIIR